MEVPYGEGVANHIGPESCGEDSNVLAEALTGVRAGQVLSREILVNFGVPTRWVTWKATLAMSLSRDMTGPRAVVDLGKYGSILCGNREVLYLPLEKVQGPHQEV